MLQLPIIPIPVPTPSNTTVEGQPTWVSIIQIVLYGALVVFQAVMLISMTPWAERRKQRRSLKGH